MGKYEVTAGVVQKAKKVIVYGPEGVGKSTFVSKFPRAVFIDTEGSTDHMNVNRLPKPSSWEMLLDEIQDVKFSKEYLSLIIDTADWAETLCIRHVCQSKGKSGIEDFGYGNGYTYVAEEWGKFLNLLQDVVDIGINVVLTCHATVRKFEQPDEMGTYDRYELKLGKKTTGQTAPITKEWADMILFLNYRTLVVAADKEGKKNKAQGNERVMYTTHHPCWDAKNRYGLPERCPLDYEVIRPIIENNIQNIPKNDVSVPNNNYSVPKNEPIVPTDNTAMKMEKEIVKSSDPYMHNDFNVFEVDERIHPGLRDLMIANKVSESEIQTAVAGRGYFPLDMPVSAYPQDFVDGVLIGAWTAVFDMVQESRNLQF